MSRPGHPYQTPQSNSPTSQHSPHSSTYAGPMYGAHYQQQQQHQHHQSFNNGYGQTHHYAFQQQHQQQPPPSYASQSFLPHYPYGNSMRQTVPSQASPIYDSAVGVPSQMNQERQGSSYSSTPVTPGNPMIANGAFTGRSASAPTTNTTLPGPIKATVPLVVKHDSDGVTWIRFDYTKDRVRKSYDIRCDVHTVDLDSLSPDFKKRNVVYPRAYRGEKYSRLKYETECNETAWALVKLNPELDGHKGLRQRAVDSWRNSNSDRSKASRRVRRESKKAKRNEQAQGQLRSQLKAKDDIMARQVASQPMLPAQSTDGSPGSTALPPLQFASQASSGAQYMPLSAGTSRSHWNNADVMAPYQDSTSYDHQFTPTDTRHGLSSTLPPTPDTMGEGSKRGSSAGSLVASTPILEHGHGHGHYKGRPLPSQYPSLNSERRDQDQYQQYGQTVASPVDNKHSVSTHGKTDVFPRVNKILGDGLTHNIGSDYASTRTHVRVGVGYPFDKILTIPATGEVRASKDRFWNERGSQLSETWEKNGLQGFSARPQALQQALNQVYRHNNQDPYSPQTKSWSPMTANRPGKYF